MPGARTAMFESPPQETLVEEAMRSRAGRTLARLETGREVHPQPPTARLTIGRQAPTTVVRSREPRGQGADEDVLSIDEQSHTRSRTVLKQSAFLLIHRLHRHGSSRLDILSTHKTRHLLRMGHHQTADLRRLRPRDSTRVRTTSGLRQTVDKRPPPCL